MSAKVSLSEQLTPKQTQLIEILLAGVSIVAAAQQVGVAEKTAHKWLALPHFQQAYKQAQQAIFDDSLSELKAGMRDVIAALKCHINATVEPTPASQVAAMKLWSELATKTFADQATGETEQSANDSWRALLAKATNEELAVLLPIAKAIRSREAEQEQSPPGASLRMVK